MFLKKLKFMIFRVGVTEVRFYASINNRKQNRECYGQIFGTCYNYIKYSSTLTIDIVFRVLTLKSNVIKICI